MTDRLVIEADDSVGEIQLTAAVDDQDYYYGDHDSDGVRTYKGKICISVAQEHAVDSYNATFESSVHLSDEQAQQLLDWLTVVLSKRPHRTH